MRAGGGRGGGARDLPFTGWEILLRKTIAIFGVCVRVNCKAERLISDRNTFYFVNNTTLEPRS